MTGESKVGVVEEVEVGVWKPPVGAGAEAATRLSEPVIPVRVLMNGNSPEKVRSRYILKWVISRTIQNCKYNISLLLTWYMPFV